MAKIGRPKIPMVGRVFGKLAVVSEAPARLDKRGDAQFRFNVLCECGTAYEVFGSSLRGKLGVKSCGLCIYEDLTGKRFGRLTVTGLQERVYGPSGIPRLRWKCKCDCGNETSVTGGVLGTTINSCGCIRVEMLVARNLETAKRLRRSRGLDENTPLTAVSVALRSSERNSGFLRAVMQRDNFTCQWCGRVGGPLNVHHLDKVADDYSVIGDFSRVVTLCAGKFNEPTNSASCYAKIHKGKTKGPVDLEMTAILLLRVNNELERSA